MDLVTVYTSDGTKTLHGAGELNFNRDQLIVTLKSPESITGWHWDHLACILQYACQPLQPPPAKTCEFALGFPNGQKKLLVIETLHAVESVMGNSIMVVRGAGQTAFVNRDFLDWYRITIAEAASKEESDNDSE